MKTIQNKKDNSKTHTTIFRSLIIIMIGLFSVIFVNAQVEKSSELFNTLQKQDKLLFEEGFNKCDISQFENLLSEDIEFYHDQGGIIKSKDEFISNLKNGICKEGSKKNDRVLVKNSLQVFALYSQGKLYGAIQTGVHLFGNSSAKFTHLWLLENDVWKLSRVLSYEHRENPKPKKKK